MRDTYLGGSVTGNTHNLASMSLSLELAREKGVNPLSRSSVDARSFLSHMLDFTQLYFFLTILREHYHSSCALRFVDSVDRPDPAIVITKL